MRMTTASAGTERFAAQEFVDAIAAEAIMGLDLVAASWMAQVESALTDPGLTTLGRMSAAREVLGRYKASCGSKLDQAA
jgi:hypothetical protein